MTNGASIEEGIMSETVSKSSLHTKVDREILRDLLLILTMQMTVSQGGKKPSRSVALERLMREYFMDNEVTLSQIDEVVKRRELLK